MEPASPEPVAKGAKRGSIMQQVKGRMFAPLPLSGRSMKPRALVGHAGQETRRAEVEFDLEKELKVRRAAGRRRLMYRAMHEALHDMKESQAAAGQPFKISFRLVANLTQNAVSSLNKALFWKVLFDQQKSGPPSSSLDRDAVLRHLREGHMQQLKSEGQQLTLHAIGRAVLSIIRMMHLGENFGKKIVTVQTSAQHLVEAVSRRIVKIVEQSMQQSESAEGVIGDIRVITEGMLKVDLPSGLKLLVKRLEDKVATIQGLRVFAGECIAQAQEFRIGKSSADSKGRSAHTSATADNMKHRDFRALMQDLRWALKKTREQQVLLTDTIDEVVRVAIQEDPDQWGEDYHNGMPGRRNLGCLAGFDVAKIIWTEVTKKIRARGCMLRAKDNDKDDAISLADSSEEEQEIPADKDALLDDLVIAGIGQAVKSQKSSPLKTHKPGSVRRGRREVQGSVFLAGHWSASRKPQSTKALQEKRQRIANMPLTHLKRELEDIYVSSNDEKPDGIRTAEEVRQKKTSPSRTPLSPSPPRTPQACPTPRLSIHPSMPRSVPPPAVPERLTSSQPYPGLENTGQETTQKRRSFLVNKLNWTRMEEAKLGQELAGVAPVAVAKIMPSIQLSIAPPKLAAEDVPRHRKLNFLTEPSDIVPISARRASAFRSKMQSPKRLSLKGGEEEREISELHALEQGLLPNQTRGKERGSIIVHLPRDWSPPSAQNSRRPSPQSSGRPNVSASSPRSHSHERSSQSGDDGKMKARAPVDSVSQVDWQSLLGSTAELTESGETQWNILASQEIAAREQDIAELRQLLLMAQHESSMWQKQAKLLQAKRTPGFAQQSLSRATQWRQKDIENLKKEIQILEMKNVSQQRHLASKRKMEMKRKKEEAFLTSRQTELESRMQSTQSSHDTLRKRTLGPRVDTLLDSSSALAQLKLKKQAAKVEALGGLCSSARVRGVEVHLWGWELDDFCFQDADLALASYVLPDVPVLSSRAAAFEAELVQNVIRDPDIGLDWTSSQTDTPDMQRSMISSQDWSYK